MRHSASMSRAAAIETAMAHWWNGSPEGQMFSLVVASEGMFHQSGGNKQVYFGISNKKNQLYIHLIITKGLASKRGIFKKSRVCSLHLFSHDFEINYFFLKTFICNLQALRL